MPAFSKIALFSSLIAYASAQQVGTNTAEVHPSLTSYKCTKAGGCVAQSTKIVIDANWRWVHGVGGYTNCYTGNTWNTSLCPDDVTCAANCALEGADYAATYGITTSGNALTLKFVTKSSGTNIGSRVYLMDTDTSYQMFTPVGGEVSFDVDVSNLPCGLNGAVYFIEMDKDGGMAKYPTNKAGAKYGTGYCDSQCPHDIKFIAGKANVEGWTASSNDSNGGSGTTGTCCSEMDLWEANSISAAYTPHVCKGVGLQACTGTDCGDGSDRYSGICDKDGCDFNSYRQGNKTFYGPGETVNTNSKFTVVTQFISSDGTASGTLTEIRRFYVQGGVVIPNSVNTVAGIPAVNSITDAFCVAQKSVFGDTPYFETLGGLAGMGASLKRGGVLALSLWDDHAVNLLWLDSTYPPTADPSSPGVARGTCATTSGVPADLEANVPNSSVTYSNIRWGELCSTFTDTGNVACGTGSGTTTKVTTTSSKTSTTSSKTTTASVKTTTAVVTTARTTTTPVVTTRVTTTTPVTTTASRTTSASAAGQTHYGQCGGTGWTGPTTCSGGYSCSVLNPYYSQCL